MGSELLNRTETFRQWTVVNLYSHIERKGYLIPQLRFTKDLEPPSPVQSSSSGWKLLLNNSSVTYSSNCKNPVLFFFPSSDFLRLESPFCSSEPPPKSHVFLDLSLPRWLPCRVHKQRNVTDNSATWWGLIWLRTQLTNTYSESPNPVVQNLAVDQMCFNGLFIKHYMGVMIF